MKPASIMRQLNDVLQKYFRWFSLGLVFLIVFLGFVFFLNPKFSEIRETGFFNLRSTERKLELTEQAYVSTHSLVERFEELTTEDVAFLQDMLPSKPELPNLFVQVEALANESGLTLANVGFVDSGPEVSGTRQPVAVSDDGETDASATPAAGTTKTAGTTIKQISVSFSVSGGRGYEHLKEFLSDIESSLRIFDVQALSYTPGDNESETYQINAVTYYLE